MLYNRSGATEYDRRGTFPVTIGHGAPTERRRQPPEMAPDAQHEGIRRYAQLGSNLLVAAALEEDAAHDVEQLRREQAREIRLVFDHRGAVHRRGLVFHELLPRCGFTPLAAVAVVDAVHEGDHQPRLRAALP